jgi:hypothetical protein
MITLRLITSMAALSTAIALGAAAAHAQELEEVKIVFEQAIPNIPKKSIVVQVVSYPQASSQRPIAMPHQPSSMLVCCPAPFAARSTMNLSRSTRSAKAGTRCPARITG